MTSHDLAGRLLALPDLDVRLIEYREAPGQRECTIHASGPQVSDGSLFIEIEVFLTEAQKAARDKALEDLRALRHRIENPPLGGRVGP